MKKLLACTICLFALSVQPVMAVEPPVKGELKSVVEKLFGAPNEKKAAVGEPPISRWVYNDFTVYFEKDRVIHSVKRKKD